MEINIYMVLKLVAFYMTLAREVSSFRIINCGSNKISNIKGEIDSLRNTKSIIELRKDEDNSVTPIVLNQQIGLELWCESDCWFSQCTLSQEPKIPFSCKSPFGAVKPYKDTKNLMESYKDFNRTKKHVCKFVVEKSFDCTGNML